MLEVRDVVKTYDGRAVVNRVSFEVAVQQSGAVSGSPRLWHVGVAQIVL